MVNKLQRKMKSKGILWQAPASTQINSSESKMEAMYCILGEGKKNGERFTSILSLLSALSQSSVVFVLPLHPPSQMNKDMHCEPGCLLSSHLMTQQTHIFRVMVFTYSRNQLHLCCLWSSTHGHTQECEEARLNF